MRLKEAMAKLERLGIRKLSKAELEEVAKPILYTAHRRLRELERQGLSHTPAYKGYMELDLPQNVNDIKGWSQLRNTVYQTYKFLNSKTSNAKRAREYWDWLEKLAGGEMDYDRREILGEIIAKFKKLAPQIFQQYESSDAIEMMVSDPTQFLLNFSEMDIAELEHLITEFTDEPTELKQIGGESEPRRWVVIKK